MTTPNPKSDPNIEILNRIQKNTFEDRAFGCIVGAFVGDSCGSFNEFNPRLADEKTMDICMTMPGGGPWRVAAGQITDDSELALCMMRGILDSIAIEENNKIISRGSIKVKNKKQAVQENESGSTSYLDQNEIAIQYKNWIMSPPFDIGLSTRAALVPLSVQNPKAKLAINSAKINNDKSQSNGSLMRCTPMAVFTSSVQKKEDAKNAILIDVKMTHPDKLVQEAILTYQLAIHYLLNH